MEDKQQYKVVLLGEGCVGKTSLVLRYCQNTFNDQHVSTLQASFLERRMNIGRKRITLAIWDTAGQERFHALGPIYYRDSNGAVLVYDITDQDSFAKVQRWVSELRKMLGSEVCLVLVGNKIDMERKRTVDQAEAIRYAASVGAEHVETSAKLNRGVEELFLNLAKQMMAKHSDDPARVARTLSNRRSQMPVIVDSESKGDGGGSGGCC